MTLHVIEVEGVTVALLQVQLVGTGNFCISMTIGICRFLCQNVLRPNNVVIDFHGNIRNRVGGTNIQHQLAVDEQVNVIVAFELEEQIICRVVDELTVTGNGIVIVSVDEGCTFLGDAHDAAAVIQEVGRLGLPLVDAFTVCDRQEGETAGRICSLEVDLVLGGRRGQGDGALRGVIVDRGFTGVAVFLGVGSIFGLTGGETTVEDVSGLAGFQRRGTQHQIVVLILRLVVGIIHIQVVQQIIGRIHEGGDAVLAVSEAADQAALLCGGDCIVAQFSAAAGAVAAVFGQNNVQLLTQGGSQIQRLAVDITVLRTIGSTLDKVVVVVAAGIRLANGQGIHQHLRDVLNGFFLIVGDAIAVAVFVRDGDQPGFQQASRVQAARQGIDQCIAEVQAIGSIGDGHAVRKLVQQENGIGYRVAFLRRLRTLQVLRIVGIGRDGLADLIAIVAIGPGIFAAIGVVAGVPAAAVVGEQHAEGNVAAGVPLLLGGIGGSSRIVHVGRTGCAKGICSC